MSHPSPPPPFPTIQNHPTSTHPRPNAHLFSQTNAHRLFHSRPTQQHPHPPISNSPPVPKPTKAPDPTPNATPPPHPTPHSHPPPRSRCESSRSTRAKLTIALAATCETTVARLHAHIAGLEVQRPWGPKPLVLRALAKTIQIQQLLARSSRSRGPKAQNIRCRSSDTLDCHYSDTLDIRRPLCRKHPETSLLHRWSLKSRWGPKLCCHACAKSKTCSFVHLLRHAPDLP